MTVKLVYDENYDLIGVAKDLESAIELAIELNSITDSTKIYPADKNGYAVSTVEKFFGGQWEESIKNLDIVLFNTLFEGTVQINDAEVYAAK